MPKPLVLKNQSGQTLLEVLLAFAVSIVVLSAIVFGITNSLSNTQYTKNQGLATSYAQEGLAIARKTRDSSWSDFYSRNGNYCLPQNSTKLPSSTDNDPDCSTDGKIGIFARKVVITIDSSSECSNGSLSGSKVIVIVSWSDNKCTAGAYCHKVDLNTCFSNLDKKGI